MPRPSQIDEQRKRLLPVISRAFSENGYRRTTTAELARRCQVQENILYRIWSSKKAMYLASINAIFEDRQLIWEQMLVKRQDTGEAVADLLAYEAKHQGEFGLYRILFDAFGEADDPEIRESLVSVYRRFYEFVRRFVELRRGTQVTESGLSPELTSWGLIGLATMANIVRELALVGPRQRQQMILSVGEFLLSEETG